VDTTPSAKYVQITITETFPGGQVVRFDQPVLTPAAIPIPMSRDALLEVRVFDPWQDNLTLSSVTVTPDSRPWDPASFDVLFHIAGDDFTGYDATYNDLASTADKANFVSDVIAGANTLFMPAGVQIRTATAGLNELTNAQVSAADPSLVVGGLTRAPTTSTQVLAYAGLGAPASDPNYGGHVDLFFVHSPMSAGGALGSCACGLKSQGGTFVGTGGNHTLYIPLFDGTGTPRTLQTIRETVTHELGHFLGLEHPTEQDFEVDDFTDTPFSDAATYDVDPTNGMLDATSVLENSGPDNTNIMFWLQLPFATQDQWSNQQIDAMRGLLSTREH
jgi:hypothetical protein